MQTSAIRLISHKPGVPLPAEYKPLSIQSSSGPVENAWLQHSDFSAWLLTKEHHSAELEDDGSFKFHGVEPGEYSLVIQLYDETPGCWPVGAVGSKIVPVVLTPEQIRTGELNLEAIEVECRPSLQPGADMRAIQFVNAAGQVVSVDDFGGQHVLLHVWASGCEPCVDSLPQLKADLAQLQETPFTAVGINIDGIKSQGQTTADRLQLHWTQTFAGEGSDLARQLRLSSIPAYYLIGPDGKLEASSGDWKEIRQLLKEQLKPSL
jgi:peroxiredoxin